MEIQFNLDGSIKRVSADEFVQQLSSGQQIKVSVLGASFDEYQFTAFGVLPNGEGTNLSHYTQPPLHIIELNSENTKYSGKLTITIQIRMSYTNAVFTYPLYLTINPIGISETTKFPITLEEVSTFLSQLNVYTTKAAADARFQQKYSLNTMRVYDNVEELTADFDKLLTNQLYAVRNDSQIGLFYKNQIGSTVECFVTLAGKAEQDSEGNVIHDVYATKASIENLQRYLTTGEITVKNSEFASKKTGTDDELATENYVDTAVGQLTSHYVTSNAGGDSFSTYAALVAGPYYYAGEIHTIDQNDYAFVDADETHDGKSSRYVYQGGQWNYQYSISSEGGGISDVKVNGTSVVEDNVANINLNGKQDKIVIESDNDITIGGLSVPSLTVQQVETIYNHLISGNSVVVSSDDGVKHFSPIVADYLGDAAIHFLYYNLIITYYVENDEVKHEYINVEGEAPTNMVTTDTAQTISGAKTFTNGMLLQNNDIESPLITFTNQYYTDIIKLSGYNMVIGNDHNSTFITSKHLPIEPDCTLGTSASRWQDLYLSGKASLSNNASIKAISAGVDYQWNDITYLGVRYDGLLPVSYYSAMNLGDSSHQWNDLYLGGDAKLQKPNSGESGKLYFQNEYSTSYLSLVGYGFRIGSSLQTDGNISPLGNYNLGTNEDRWKDLYLSGTVKVGATVQFGGGNGYYAQVMGSGFEYDFNDTAFIGLYNRDLGNAGNQWKDIYFNGKLKDGTNELSLQDIADGLGGGAFSKVVTADFNLTYNSGDGCYGAILMSYNIPCYEGNCGLNDMVTKTYNELTFEFGGISYKSAGGLSQFSKVIYFNNMMFYLYFGWSLDPDTNKLLVLTLNVYNLQGEDVTYMFASVAQTIPVKFVYREFLE